MLYTFEFRDEAVRLVKGGLSVAAMPSMSGISSTLATFQSASRLDLAHYPAVKTAHLTPDRGRLPAFP